MARAEDRAAWLSTSMATTTKFKFSYSYIALKAEQLFDSQDIHRHRSSPEVRVYCQVERNGTLDVSASLARRDHRKSKFRLRHDIKLN